MKGLVLYHSPCDDGQISTAPVEDDPPKHMGIAPRGYNWKLTYVPTWGIAKKKIKL